MESPAPKKYLCSLGSGPFMNAAKRIRRTAKELGHFTDVFVYEEIPDSWEPSVNRNTRGAGFWFWKPFLILESFSRMRDNDILVYVDSGCLLFKSNNWDKYFNLVSIYDAIFFELEHKEAAYTKGDTFNHFGYSVDSYLGYTNMIPATAFILRKTPNSIKLMEEWKNILINHTNLVNNNPSIISNSSLFVDHRHDQSALSLLIKTSPKLRIKLLPDETWPQLPNQAIFAARSRE
jgi:hypothetical protein